MFLSFWEQILGCSFMVLNVLCKLAQCYYTEKWQLSMVFIEVIFCYNCEI